MRQPPPTESAVSEARDEEARFQAQVLRVIALTVLAIATPVLARDLWAGLPLPLLPFVFFYGAAGAALLALRLGATRAGWIAFIALLFVSICANILRSGGLDAPNGSGLLVIVFIAGRMLGARWAVAASLVGIGFLVGVAAMHDAGLVPPTSLPPGPYRRAVAPIAVLIFFGVLSWYVFNRHSEQLRQAEQAAADSAARAAAVALAHSANERLQAAIEGLDEAFALWDREDRLVVCNRKFLEISAAPQLLRPGVRAEELLRAAAASGRIPLAVGREEDWVQTRLAVRRQGGGQEEMQHGDRWYLLTSQRLPDGAMVTSMLDFTARKRAEDQLRASQARFEALFRASPTPASISTVDDGRLIDVNEAHEAYFGYPRERVVGRSIRELNLYRDLLTRERVLDQLDERGHVAAIEAELLTARGDVKTALVSAEYLDWHGARVVLLQATDITERKQAERALRASQEQLEALFRTSPTPTRIFAYDNYRTLDCNSAYVRLCGYTREELMGRRMADLGVFVDAESNRRALAQVKAEGRVDGAEYEIVTASGERRSTMVYMRLVEWQEGKAYIAQVIDITERKRAEAALQESELRFSTMFHQSPAPLALVSLSDRRFRDVNQAFIDLFGYGRETVMGRSSAEFGAAGDPGGRSQLYDALQRDGKVDQFDLVSLTAQGVQNTSLVSGRRMSLGGEQFVMWNFADVTELRRVQHEIARLNASLETKVEARTAELKRALEHLQASQEALLQSEKLAALGRLVAGIAHELNTPIGNSLLSASTLAERTRAFARDAAGGGLRRSTLTDYVTDATEAAGILARNLEKAAQLISSFKQVAADQTSSQRRGFALKEVVDEVLLAHRPMLRKSPIRVAADIPEAIRLDSYPGPLGQVLGNLITNAVLHGYEGSSEGRVTVLARPEGHDSVEIAVIDEGRGIPEGDLKRIFDPFFTTRMGRGGTGLGLGICHSIVTEALGGTIRVQSRPGQGSTFTVRIPLTAPLAPAQKVA